MMSIHAGASLLLFLACGTPHSVAAAQGPNLQPGTMPAQWNAGNNCQVEPDFQVHAYNEDFFIIRESKCATGEAPFVFLFMGDQRALLMDTGAVPSLNLYGVVDRIIKRWSTNKGLAPVPLVVGHTHSHGDHTAGDSGFQGQPGVQTVVGTSLNAVKAFWGFQNWPNDKPTFDLGHRVLDILAIPGHHSTSIAVYDRKTGVLLTGDSVYPGHLFVPSSAAWVDFKNSLDRMVRFSAASPISLVLGNHIEFSNTPFAPYPWATSVHPDERKLEFQPTILLEIQHEANLMGSQPTCKVFKDFVIHPTYLCSGSWNG